MELGLRRVKFLVIDNIEGLGPNLDAMYRPLLPWTAAHYLDPDVPGSLRAEVPATAAYLEAIWARLHREASPLVGYAWPAPPRRLRSVDASLVDAWVTVVFGAGAVVGSLNEERVAWVDEAGDPVPFELHHTRWSFSRPMANTRLVQLRPTADLLPDHAYTVSVAEGVELVGGGRTDARWSYTFRTPCAPGVECAPPEAGAPDEGAAGDAGEAGGGADVGPGGEGAGPGGGGADAATSGDPAGAEASGGDGCQGAPVAPVMPWWPALLARRRRRRR